MTSERQRRIDDLIRAALAREPGKRAAFLAKACAGDDDLRTAVRSLISSNEETNGFIESPGIQDAAGLPSHTTTDTTLGQSIGPFQVLSLLGAGGMGAVYLAEDTRLRRKVALKLIEAGLVADGRMRAR